MPHVADTPDSDEASFHDAAFYGSFAAVWHYCRSWLPALHGRQLAHRGPGEGFPYQQHVHTAWQRIQRAHAAVCLDAQHGTLLPADARFPEIHTRLDDGRLTPATIPLGLAPAGPFDDDHETDSPAFLYDLDALDATCHPHAQRAASAVVASRAFLSLYHSAHTTHTGRARLLDASVARGPFSFWRRLPDTDPHLPHNPFFAFPNPEHFPIALAVDLLVAPPVPGDPNSPDVVCWACHPPPHVRPPPTIEPVNRHFVNCMHGVRLHTTCHDPVVQALVPFLDAVHGAHRVIAERGGLGGHRSLDQWMQGPGAGLRKVPDIVLENFDGERCFTVIDVKTLDPAGPTHINTNHTDRTRLAAHLAVARRCRDTEYGPMPERMRLIVLPVSIFGAIGSSGQTFISELSRRMRGTVPSSLLPHASWATPKLAPMIRMALTHAARRGLAASIHTHWHRGVEAPADGAPMEEG